MSRRNHQVMRRAAALASAVALVAANAGIAVGQLLCRPVLKFEDVRFSAMDRETLERIWTAHLSVDASRCATTSGRFQIGFAQQKETAPDIGFHAPFSWKPGSVEVSLAFAPDESVAAYWVYDVAACPCRN